MTTHWSEVDIGEYFDVVVTYDPTIYSAAEVRVPFYRTLPDGYAQCLHSDCNQQWGS